jgi:hypothetical protein
LPVVSIRNNNISVGERRETPVIGEREQRSEVARLLACIQSEYQSAQQGLSGLAFGTGQHAFITQRMENMGRYHKELQNLVGEMPAMAMIAEQLNTVQAPGQSVSE